MDFSLQDILRRARGLPGASDGMAGNMIDPSMMAPGGTIDAAEGLPIAPAQNLGTSILDSPATYTDYIPPTSGASIGQQASDDLRKTTAFGSPYGGGSLAATLYGGGF